MELEVLKNNSLIVNKYDEPIHSVEEGMQRIKEIKLDYEKIVETVTERKFYLEGKTLYEMRDLHKHGEHKGTWIQTYESLGYKEMQVSALIKKYEIASNSYSIGMGKNAEKTLDNLEKLSMNETEQLSKLKLSEAQAVLESENAKAELKKLKEEMKLKKEIGEENFLLKKEIEESKREIQDLSEELSILSKELNNRPKIEVEKIVQVEKVVKDEKIVEVKPADYENLKKLEAEYRAKEKEMNMKIKEMEEKSAELTTRITRSMRATGIEPDVKAIFIGKMMLVGNLKASLTILKQANSTEEGKEVLKKYRKQFEAVSEIMREIDEEIQKIETEELDVIEVC